MNVLVDARILYHSGIGHYIRNLLCHMVGMPEIRFTLAGQPAQIDRFCVTLPSSANRLKRVAFRAPIYVGARATLVAHTRSTGEVAISFLCPITTLRRFPTVRW